MESVVGQFTTTQISRITGFSMRKLDYWANSRLLVPSLQQSSGPGTRKLYSFNDLVKINFIKQLQKEGWSIQKIRRAIKHLNEFIEEKPEYRNIRLVHDKHSILILCETEEKQKLLFDGLNPAGQQVSWIILEFLFGEAQKNAELVLNASDSVERATDVA